MQSTKNRDRAKMFNQFNSHQLGYGVDHELFLETVYYNLDSLSTIFFKILESKLSNHEKS